jgi:hypothetical protein
MRKKLLRTIWWLFGAAIVTILCNYVIEARKRITGKGRCNWIAVSNHRHASYMAKFCYLTYDTVLVRLYDEEQKRLLAERVFFESDRPNFYWKSGALGYGGETYGGVIALPPTVLDRWRTRLP